MQAVVHVIDKVLVPAVDPPVSKPEPKPEPKPQPKPEPKPEPAPQPKPTPPVSKPTPKPCEDIYKPVEKPTPCKTVRGSPCAMRSPCTPHHAEPMHTTPCRAHADCTTRIPCMLFPRHPANMHVMRTALDMAAAKQARTHPQAMHMRWTYSHRSCMAHVAISQVQQVFKMCCVLLGTSSQVYQIVASTPQFSSLKKAIDDAGLK